MVRCTFGILDIDGDGLLDVERWSSQQFARVDDPLAPHPPGLVAGGGRIIDASSRFVERGGSWEPDQLYSAASRRRRWANYPVHGCGWFVESPGASLVHIKLLVAGG